MGIQLNDLSKQIVKTGNKTQFCHDIWVGAEKLKVTYPRLYELDRNKSCKVAERLNSNRNNWQWSSNPADAGLTTDLENLLAVTTSICFLPGDDHISCVIAPDGSYRVDIMRKKIEAETEVTNNPTIINRCKLIPIWRALLNRIPSDIAIALANRASDFTASDHLSSDSGYIMTQILLHDKLHVTIYEVNLHSSGGGNKFTKGYVTVDYDFHILVFVHHPPFQKTWSILELWAGAVRFGSVRFGAVISQNLTTNRKCG
ncbi:unnamed protein product [Lactuca virosa]|uniref:Uncharacterized protein n=1 Tax=Lactuca virosa TaxID=75947 RepID=A0AAU9MLU3_9ASTR|nr:unnamed protein product [Lactuca virosa]